MSLHMKMPGWKSACVLTFLCILAICPSQARANTARAKAGMVVTVHPLATDAGAAVLKNGGNAIDAGIEAALMLGVVDGHDSGIGGGCFILIRTAKGETIAIDGRETAPSQATRDMYIRNGKPTTQLSQVGALASGVPGALEAYAQTSRRFGKKLFSELLIPAADVAEKGFPIDAKYALRLREELDNIKRFPETARILLKEDGSSRATGDILQQPDLARTYRKIAENGVAWFYNETFADLTAQWMAKNGGILRQQDFAHYQIQRREPITSTYRGYTIIGFPPPSSGGVHVAQILNILEKFNLDEKREADRIHLTAEAMKLAFADRAFWLGDPDFVPVPRGLLDKQYAADRANKIDPNHASKVEHGTPPHATEDLFKKHTTHIAAADADGNWIAITTTLNTAFGSKVIIPGTGVLLNSQMDDFAIAPGTANFFGLVGSEANAIAPGKRPLSSMSPTIVLKDGKPIMTLGAAGGPTIISQVLEVLTNVIDLRDDLPKAMQRPRFHHQWSPDVLRIENTVPEDVRAQLEKRGHKLDVKDPEGATNAIYREEDGTFVGVSDPRLQGKAAGFD
jgi:gamma-glutamyltranspeptidase/glutathione hydrolase